MKPHKRTESLVMRSFTWKYEGKGFTGKISPKRSLLLHDSVHTVVRSYFAFVCLHLFIYRIQSSSVRPSRSHFFVPFV